MFFDSFLVSIIGDTHGTIIFLSLFDEGEIGRNFSKEDEIGFFKTGCFTTINFGSKYGNLGDSSLFGEVANQNLFGGSKFGNFAIFGSDAEPDYNGFFKLSDPFPSNGKKFTNLFQCFTFTVQPKATRDNFLFTILFNNTQATLDGFRDCWSILGLFSFLHR